MAMQYRTGKRPAQPGFNISKPMSTTKSFRGQPMERTGEIQSAIRKLNTPSKPANHSIPNLAYRMQPKTPKW